MLFSELSTVIVILGGCHMLMSFMVVVWSVMTESDFEKLCFSFYIPFSVSLVLNAY